MKPGGLPMKMYILPFALLAGGAWVSAMAELPAPVERQDTVEQIDFAGLHQQAASALQALRISQERRMAFQQIDASVF